jgi:DNA mismatch repair protein MutS
MALIKEYFDLTRKYKVDYGDNSVLLMQVGSFFEVYGILDKKSGLISGSQILDFSRICELNVVEKNVCVGKDNVVMAGFKDIMVEKYIKKLQESGFTSIIYTQDQAAKNTTRSLAGIFSPGTYFSNETQKLTNNLTCIWVSLVNNKIFHKGKHVIVGVSNIDIYTGKTSIFQFKEIYINNPTTYDELERFISIYNPSEVIIISNLPTKEIDDIINYANIKSSSIHKIKIYDEDESNNIKDSKFLLRAKNCEKQGYQKEILCKFFKIDDYETFIQNFYDNDIATQSFCFLLDFVYQHNQHLVSKISEPVFENCSSRLILANHSLKQLNIIDDNNYTGKYSSVMKMLNECLTPMGKRKFDYTFLNPTTNVIHLEREYNITEHYLDNYDVYNDFLRQNLSTIKDISKCERQVFLRKISPKLFCGLYHNVSIIKNIYNFIIQNNKLNFVKDYLTFFDANTSKIDTYCDNVMEFIEQNIDLKLAEEIELTQTQNFDINFINRDVDTELDNKKDTIKESEEKLESIKNYLNSLILDKGKTSEFIKIHETEKNNFSLICTSRRCKLLEDNLPQISTVVKLKFNRESNLSKEFDFKVSKKQFIFSKQTASNNIIEDEQIKDICKTITSIKVEMKELITHVYYKFVEKFESFQYKMESIINFITLIDVIYGKANIAKKYNYCKPKIVQATKSFVNAKALRHCLIERLQTNELYVTNDIVIGNGYIDGILLYGTNAVGKTSLIRALGISLIMAQSGLFVPCAEFTYKPYNYIFTRILGNDNIFKGLSTFAVEMSELRTILRLADENSLVLGDELCSGTEISSAISIFVAGIQRLNQLKSSFIFATHLHEIVDYDEINSLTNLSLKHMSVIYNKEQDILIYDRKLRDGPGNSMYGLEVCKSLSLPEDFLNDAYNIRMKYHPESDSLLSKKSSHFNAKKIMNNCEKCGLAMGTEVHHLQHQSVANNDGIINNGGSVFHKNNLANLITVCEKCHNDIHSSGAQHKKVKTSKGYQIREV